MRLTSSIAACLTACAVAAIIVVAVHGQQPSRVATSGIFLVPAASHQQTDKLALAASSAAPSAPSGTKPKAAPRYTAPVSRAPGSIVSASAGLGPLTWSSCLASVATANAVRLSRQGWVQPYHTNGASLDLGCHLGNQGGENVGWWSGGVNDTQLNTMFMNSPEHRANIMGPYHYVGTAWARGANGAAYIAVEFS